MKSIFFFMNSLIQKDKNFTRKKGFPRDKALRLVATRDFLTQFLGKQNSLRLKFFCLRYEYDVTFNHFIISYYIVTKAKTFELVVSC